MAIKSYVEDLARQHGVQYVRTSADVLADAFTRLSDDSVVTDSTEDLLVDLKRAQVIDGPTMLDLLDRHMDECERV